MQGATGLPFTLCHCGLQCSKNAYSRTKGALTQGGAEPPPTHRVHGLVTGEKGKCGFEPLGSQDWLFHSTPWPLPTCVPHSILRSAWGPSRGISRDGQLRWRQGGEQREQSVPGGLSPGLSRALPGTAQLLVLEPLRERAQGGIHRPPHAHGAWASPTAHPSCLAFPVCPRSASLTASSKGQSRRPPACHQGLKQCPELTPCSVILPNT